MKKILLLIALILVLTEPQVFHSLGQATSDTAYQIGDFEVAINGYLEQLKTEGADASIYYNLANAYRSIQQPALSLLFTLRAKELNPRDAQLQIMMTLLRNELGSPLEETRDVWQTMGMLTHDMLTLPELSIAVWIIWTCAWGLGLVYWLFKKYRQILRVVLVPVALLALAGIILLGTRYYVTVFQPSAIVLADATIAYSGADTSYLPLFNIPIGHEVRVLAKVNDWIQISTRDGQQGWLLKNRVEYINPD